MKIELSNYEAISLSSFLMEFEKDLYESEQARDLLKCIETFKMQVFTKISQDEMEEVMLDMEVSRLLGNSPDNAGGKPIKRS